MKPVNRKELIRRLHLLSFTGPYSGGRHQFMHKDQMKLRIRNPHGKDIGTGLLNLILKQAGIMEQEWEKC